MSNLRDAYDLIKNPKHWTTGTLARDENIGTAKHNVEVARMNEINGALKDWNTRIRRELTVQAIKDENKTTSEHGLHGLNNALGLNNNV